MNVSWYKRKDGIETFKYGRYIVLEIKKKDKEHYNGEYDFYRCFVFNKGELVASDGIQWMINYTSANTPCNVTVWEEQPMSAAEIYHSVEHIKEKLKDNEIIIQCPKCDKEFKFPINQSSVQIGR